MQKGDILIYLEAVFTNISNSCLQDIMLIPNCTSGKDVYTLATDTLNNGSGTVGPINLV